MTPRGVLRLVADASGTATMELDTDLEGFLRELAGAASRAHRPPRPLIWRDSAR